MSKAVWIVSLCFTSLARVCFAQIEEYLETEKVSAWTDLHNISDCCSNELLRTLMQKRIGEHLQVCDPETILSDKVSFFALKNNRINRIPYYHSARCIRNFDQNSSCLRLISPVSCPISATNTIESASNPHHAPHQRKLYTPFDWTQPKYYETSKAIAIRTSIFYLNRSPGGILLSQFDTVSKNWIRMSEFPFMTDADGWDVEMRYATICVAAIGNSLYVFGRGQFSTYLAAFDSYLGQWSILPSFPFLRDSDGFTLPQSYKTVRMAAVGSSLYIVARGNSCINLASFDTQASTWALLPSLNQFTNDAVWSLPQYYVTLKLTAFDTDLWLYIRGPVGVNLIEFNTVTAKWGSNVLTYAYFTDAANLNLPKYYETTHVAAIPSGIYIFSRVLLGIDTVFFDVKSRAFSLNPLLPMCADSGGWGVPLYYKSVQMMTCGSKAFVLARGYVKLHQGLLTSPNTQWNFITQFYAFGDALGWTPPSKYTTFKQVCVGNDVYAIARNTDELQIKSCTPPSANWNSEIALYGFCVSSCRTCSANVANQCLTCADSYFMTGKYPNSCDACNITCKTCFGQSEKQCLTCKENAILQFDNSCMCDALYFLDKSTGDCQPCYLSCAECVDYGENRCTKCLFGASLAGAPPSSCVCSSGFYLNPSNSQCSKCLKFCTECQTADFCIECNRNSTLTDFYCECADGFYESPEYDECQKCPIGCATCILTGCFSCSSNYYLFGRECVTGCPNGYVVRGKVCQEAPPIPSLIADFSNTLLCQFSKEVTKNATNADIRISVYTPNAHIFEVAWSVGPTKAHFAFEIRIEFLTDMPTSSSTAELTFLYPADFHDSSGHQITIDHLAVSLNPYPESTLFSFTKSMDAMVASAASHAAVIAGVVGGFFGNSGSKFFSLLSQLQLITYIPMMDIKIPQELASTLIGLTMNNVNMNPFETIYAGNDAKPPDFAAKYGCNSTIFLINSGYLCLSTIALALSYVCILGLSRMSQYNQVALYCRNIVKNYQWEYPLRFVLQSYLDFGVDSLLHFSNGSVSSTGYIENSLLAGLVFIGFLSSPIAVLLFTLRHTDLMLKRNNADFNKSWGVLFQEFAVRNHISSISFYSYFLFRRLIYAFSLICMSHSADLQMLLAIAFSVAVSDQTGFLPFARLLAVRKAD